MKGSVTNTTNLYNADLYPLSLHLDISFKNQGLFYKSTISSSTESNECRATMCVQKLIHLLEKSIEFESPKDIADFQMTNIWPLRS